MWTLSPAWTRDSAVRPAQAKGMTPATMGD
jgi:hypothetical protein